MCVSHCAGLVCLRRRIDASQLFHLTHSPFPYQMIPIRSSTLQEIMTLVYNNLTYSETFE